MKEISHLLRKAYLDLLTPFTISGVTIPIFDTIVNPNTPIPTYSGVKAYIVILDQNEVERIGNRCAQSQLATITLDIVTKFNSGGVFSSLPCELISDQVQQAVNTLTGQPISINQPDIQVLTTRKSLSRNFTELGSSLTVVRKRIIFEHNIYES